MKVVAAVLLAVLLAVGCADPAENAGKPQSAGMTEYATTVDGVQHLSVQAGPGVRFMQTDLRAHVGTIVITLSATGGLAHDLTFVDGPQSATSEISSGMTSVTLHITQPGVYHFVCSVHSGMRGTLTVSAA
jgi:plastocyanin